LLTRTLLLTTALVSASAAHASCTTTTYDFNDGTLQGWSQYGSFSLSNNGSAAYYSGNSGGCTLHGMYQDFDGGDSLSISYNYVAGSTNYSSVTNSYFSLRDASDNSSIYGTYAGYPRYGIGGASGSYSDSWTTEIAGVAEVRLVMGTYDCWSTNWSQWNQIDDIVVTVCSSDEDGDGYDSIAEGGTDCDDSDPSINPAAPELCDGVDNNCDGSTDEDSASDAKTWYADTDSDGYGDTAASDIDCYQPTGYIADGTDCDDTDATTYPGATEYCDGHDDDCDGDTDEDDSVGVLTWYADSDSDGYGNAASSDIDCYQPTGYVADATDCDDSNGTTYPGADEYCDGHDDNCDGDIDEDASVDVSTWYVDSDADGYGNAASTDIDCDAPTGYVADATDCDDTEATTYPGADEYCDGHDDDCDGDTDEDQSVDVLTWYADSDGDGEGDAAASDIDCYQPTGYVENSTDCDDTTIVLNTADLDADGFTSCDSDCNDTDAAINIDAAEIWYDGVDQNCDEWSDYDQDADGFEHLDYDADGDGIYGTDCDDEDADINTDATEIWYDGTDQDCDTLSDYDSDYDGQDSETYGGEDCNDADPNTYTGAPDTPYDGIITDCANANDYDADGDGVLAEEHGGKDCDDANADINPNAEEIWYDGVDQDCDGNDDDQDGDGYALADDCDDTNADLAEDCSGDTGDTGGGNDTGTGYDTLDKDSGGCFSSTTGGTPVGRWALLMTGLLFFRRRRTVA
jgi:hypothetical protein